MREKAKEMWILGELISVTAQDEGVLVRGSDLNSGPRLDDQVSYHIVYRYGGDGE